MFKEVFAGILLFKIVLVLTKEAELPLCPTNVLYFPQNLPMHCRMPTNADYPGMSGALSALPQNHQNSPSDKQPPLPMPIPIPQGFPGPIPIPGPMPMSGTMPMPGSMPIPGPIGLPRPVGPSGPMPFSGPMPLSQGPGHKLPVIVMPFYSQDASFKKATGSNYLQNLRPKKRKIRHRRRKPKFIHSSETSSSTDTETSSETSSSSSSEYKGWWKGKSNHRRFNGPIRMKKRKHYQKRQLLTPVLQYVTKDGYVIFEKKISKNEAKDWLTIKKDEKVDIGTRIPPEAVEMESKEPNEDQTAEKVKITEDNVEVMTKRNAHRRNRVNAHRDKASRIKVMQQPH